MSNKARHSGKPARLTLSGIAREALAKAKGNPEKGGEAFGYALRNFLDGFYAAPKPIRNTLLDEEPPELRSSLHDGGVADAYLAALANHLAGQFEIPRPKWARAKNKRFPEKPWFAMKAPEARIWLLTQSPAAFRERNLFISEDALTRA
jgi:hypothetical protein